MAKLSASKAAAQMGWTYLEKPPAEFPGEWAFVPGIRTSGTVRHLMRGPLGPWRATAFVSTFVVYTGQVNVPVSRTVFALDTPPWPITDIAPRSWLERLLLPLRSRWTSGVRVEDPRFNKTFRVRTDDEDFAVLLLSPEVQAHLLAKRTVRWYIGYGRLCLVYQGAMRPERLAASAERLRTMMSLIPPEMEEWEHLA